MAALNSTTGRPMLTLDSIKKSANESRDVTVIYGTPGIGKTSLAVYSNNPLFMMSNREDGLLTLIRNGLIPETAHLPMTRTWEEAVDQFRFIVRNDIEYDTLVVDTANGIEEMLKEYVLQTHYKNNNSKFVAYGDGYKTLATYVPLLINLLDEIKSKMKIILLSHWSIKKVNNPSGPDYDKYIPDISNQSWSQLERFADNVLFLTEQVNTSEEGSKNKASNSGHKVLYTKDTGFAVAKNRCAFPGIIHLSGSPKECWQQIVAKAGYERSSLKLEDW